MTKIYRFPKVTPRYVVERHPYIAAHVAYVNGQLHSINAIALVTQDREFIAECELNGLDTLEAARCVVLDKWRKQLATGQFIGA